MKESNQNNKLLELNYNVPISVKEYRESGNTEQEDGFFVEGIAINATTTENGHKFLAEELRSFASTLNDKPMLLDHKNEINSIVGRVIKSEFSETAQNVQFRAKVMDEKIKEMIKDGRINSVSIGAVTKEIEESEDGTLVPHGLVGKELSFVAIPADPNAQFGIGMALKCAYESNSVGNDLIKLNSGENMEKEVSESVSKEEFSKLDEKVDSQAKLLGEMVGKLDEFMAKMQESDEDEAQAEPAEEPKEEPKEEVEEPEVEESEESEEEDEDEEVEESGKYTFVEGYGSLSGGAFSVIRN